MDGPIAVEAGNFDAMGQAIETLAIGLEKGLATGPGVEEGGEERRVGRQGEPVGRGLEETAKDFAEMAPAGDETGGVPFETEAPGAFRFVGRKGFGEMGDLAGGQVEGGAKNMHLIPGQIEIVRRRGP